MTKTILIDGQKVVFRATAAIPRLYRIKFNRDIMKDMRAIKKATEEQKDEIPEVLLEAFENMTYLFAKHADPEGVPASVEEWLDRFNTFSIYEVFPEVLDLWALNLETQETSKKKFWKRSGK